MQKFKRAMLEWPKETFSVTLKDEIQSLPEGVLPLRSVVGYVDDSNISATILNIFEQTGVITAKVGIFFSEIVICCGCGDDPMPQNAYREIKVALDKTTAEASFTLIED